MNDVMEFFLKLVVIDSESKDERQIVDLLKEELTKLGFAVEEDESYWKSGGNAGNIYAFKDGLKDRSPILFCAHTDTVKPGKGVKYIIDNGLIKSDGKTVLGADDKSGLAEIIGGISAILNSGIKHAPLEILFTVSEEIGLNGVKNFDINKLKAKLGYAFDAQDIGQYMNGAPAQNTFQITLYGKEAHAGMEPEKGINAIQMAAEAITKLPNGRIDEETTANIGFISGGTATNIVPNKVIIHAEARSHDNEKLGKLTEDIINTFKTTVKKYVNGDCQASVEVNLSNEYKSFYLDEKQTVVQIARKAAENIGAKPSFVKGGGGSDANIINAFGIPMLVAGTGMQKYHTVNEYISINDLKRGSELVKEIIRIYSENEE